MTTPAPNGSGLASGGTALGCSRDFLGNRFVYAVISPRAGGLSLGVNLSPDRKCNFNCVYCEVDRSQPASGPGFDVEVMTAELEHLVSMPQSRLAELPCFRTVPPELLQMRHVALSGDGEPTLCPEFLEAVESVVHLRSSGRCPFFKLVLITNSSGLDRPDVAEAVSLFGPRDEIWAKLDAGTQEHMDRVNLGDCSLEKVLANILHLARQRSVVIQSLFPSVHGLAPQPAEVEAYVSRLRELREAGAKISLVQIYSATRPTANLGCGHVSLRTLSGIAQRVRDVAGLKAEVF